MIRRILISTDGSPHAGRALDFAADLASKYGATLHLVHVLQHTKVPDEFKAFHEAEHVDEPPETFYLKQIGNRVIEEASVRLLRSGNVRIEPALLLGNPTAAILRHAKAHDVDVIVVGHREPGTMESLFAGNVAEKVCHEAERPCVTVK
jgi:nucleotide-binding universal stress UspA family protein